MYLLFSFFSYLTIVCATRLYLGIALVDQLPLIACVDHPYYWTVSEDTFKSDSGPISYSAVELPSWLTFDSLSRTFHGTPTAEDEGNPRVTLMANDGTSSLNSSALLCVTSYPEPILDLPLHIQFNSSNPALSDVYPLALNSSLDTGRPALRSFRGWSFSVGFNGKTFSGPGDLFYDVRQQNGASLPFWLKFDRTTYALNGIAPYENIPDPYVLPLEFVVSDQQGYSSSTLPFDIIIANHELSLADPTPPTMNISIASQLDRSFLSPEDFPWVLVDGKPIQPSIIQDLEIDVAQYNWLHYDRSARRLYGDSTNNSLSTDHASYLPVRLTTTFNQSIKTNYMITAVPSSFLEPNLEPLQAKPGVPLHFDLSPDLDGSVPRESLILSASFDPSEASQFLSFDSSNTRLTGVIPGDSRLGRYSVTFSACSTVTHATSYANLSIITSPSEDSVDGSSIGHHRHKLSAAMHEKLNLVVMIVFGTLGGLCSIGASLAVMRRCARVEDTAVTGEEGRNAWSSEDRKWYGIASPNASFERSKDGYGWTKWAGNESCAIVPDLQSPHKSHGPHYDSVGLDLRPGPELPVRVPTGNSRASPGVMKKKEFVSMIKNTVRQVSDKYKRTQARVKDQPVIGKPILITPSKSGECDMPSLQPGSTFMLDSSSMSTEEHSIPRQRSDFGPPRPPVQVHFQDGTLTRQTSSSSERSHISGILQAEAGERTQTSPTRPKLVPFTSANRVPVPQRQSIHSLGKNPDSLRPKRVSSQEAKVWRIDADQIRPAMPTKSDSSDELCMGLHYIQTLGGDGVDESTPSLPTVATTYVRSSFSSLESSHQGHGTNETRRVLVRVGEKFKFRIQIPSHSRGVFYELKLANGRPLPQFLHHDLNLKGGFIELHGIPSPRDFGIFDVGVHVGDRGGCVARTIIDVVGRS